MKNKPLSEKEKKTLIETAWYDDEEHTPKEWTNYEVFFKKDVKEAVEKLKGELKLIKRALIDCVGFYNAGNLNKDDLINIHNHIKDLIENDKIFGFVEDKE